jgi:hypothetical protein
MVTRGIRLYGVLDLVFALGYAYAAFAVAPSRELAFSIGVGIVSAALFVAGVALLLRLRGAWTLALSACGLLVVGCALVITGLFLSSAYLRGVYGGFGRGAAIVCLLAAALVIEVAGLLPILELRFLLRPEVRAAFNGPPAARRA